MHPDEFQELYHKIRLIENRIYTDEELKKLPEIPNRHPHIKEWKLRNQSVKQLSNYLKDLKKPLKILEIGCGNGWLSAYLAKENYSWQVLGQDINTYEIEQAKKVFNDIPNVQFYDGIIDSKYISLNTYDIVLFAASIQYFPDLSTILSVAQSLLHDTGEIHIIDSPFYSENELPAAKERSKSYFQSIGFPEAHRYYFHPAFKSLHSFKYVILYDPNTWISKIKFRRSPFYWIKIFK